MIKFINKYKQAFTIIGALIKLIIGFVILGVMFYYIAESFKLLMYNQ